ncbi:hypothetical protein EHQ58_07185 [Leptospira ognonensis]|uniref:Uncharacterized protein n=1 Tax=Leptospira ognonensis TaxID=2484945 RepID=A0A4R9K492_9LEPT|nr:hypothetical protein [Leptospira ognonensis]TGL60276.1 hypothetical protein EHQ58_07185 [Leptospira ognonensis]
MILKIFYTSILLSLLFASVECKENPPETEILKVQNDTSLDLNSAVSKVLPLIFPHLLKEWKLEPADTSKLWVLRASYGGTTALTFDSQKEYAENLIRTQAMYTAQLAAAISNLPIKEIRLSLTKPLYVKGENHPDVGIQEFEIFRTALSTEKAKAILAEHKTISPFSSFKNHKEELSQLYGKIQAAWTIELNQLGQITVE